ncbi:Cof-type HAD-IIB family hydrolase [Thermoflavimicrobium dichotomicum]|uniref:Cof subfamily of IIB subfamily of haloacid dehalogenase superfamily/HAD-superfamily hydrolase, subfamily IIB n=1 Tax=Thermoflavimicrobium dichotomicum TaxID=46223 RepID=A0A1I3S8I6_9BACL|nr:Cof-type HAD-IIB family hydrolase [Thermoflavimicrobium dichotomicum]SFJ53836.1 hypothetical protein SAMN05421852_11219 [Thermoflavimicrobium dichotomicum]
MEKKIVFFDIDGTFLDDEKKILDSTKQAIQRLHEKGIYTAIATGRPPQMFDWILQEYQIRSYIAMNGQYVVFDGQEIYANPMDQDALQDLTMLAMSRGDAIGYCNHKHVRVTEEGHPFVQASFQSLKYPYPSADCQFYQHSKVFQGYLFCDEKDVQMYMDRYPDLYFFRWHEYAADILPKGCSKAVGIRKLIEIADIKLENTYAFGDGLNDLEMIEMVGKGIAMGNAVPEVKRVADVITSSNCEDGIFRGLMEVGLLEE